MLFYKLILKEKITIYLINQINYLKIDEKEFLGNKWLKYGNNKYTKYN